MVKIAGSDLNVFEFDYDTTWAAVLLDADEHVYGRYGGRDASGPENKFSLKGLRYAMTAALAAHRARKPGPPPAARPPPARVEDLPAAKRVADCIHCHQVNEFRRAKAKADGTWKRQDVWVYPPPENVGFGLEPDRGDMVAAVGPGSPAEKAGLRVGDRIVSLNGRPVASFADATYALQRGPAGAGEIPVVWRRGAAEHSAKLVVADGWRKTNLTWRPSMLDMLPALGIYGRDLTAADRKALAVPDKRLAFRQGKTDAETAALGVRPGDVILGLDGVFPEMRMTDFLAYVRRNHLKGDRVVLHVLRDGKRVDIPLALP